MASTMVAPGRMAWAITLRMKAGFRPGATPSSYAWRTGNQPRLKPNRNSASIASQK